MTVPKWDHIVRKKGEIEEQVPGLVAKQTKGETNGGRSHRGVDGGRNYGGARQKPRVMSGQGGVKGKKEPKQAEGVKERGAIEGLEACGGGRATTDLRTGVGTGTHTHGQTAAGFSSGMDMAADSGSVGELEELESPIQNFEIVLLSKCKSRKTLSVVTFLSYLLFLLTSEYALYPLFSM